MKKPTELLFFFDTEDYTSQKSCDAARDLANLFASEGLTGHFAMVGLVAEQLVRWRRWDVLDALRPHQIGSHTYGHSLHPDICEQTDLADANAAVRAALLDQSRTAGMLQAATGTDRVLFSVPPGNSKSYADMYAGAELGFPFYCDTVLEDGKGSDLYYCNVRHIPYVLDWEQWLMPDTPMDTDEVLDRLAARDRAILYTHPNRAVYSEFWDMRNYCRENRHPFGEWEECPARPPEQVERYYARIREALRRLKSDPRFKLTTLPELLSTAKPRVDVRRDDLPALRETLLHELAPVRNPSLSVADVFLAVCTLLRGEDVYHPDKVWGFTEAPQGVSERRTLRSADLRAAAFTIGPGLLPARIQVGGETIGPADFLYAGLEALCTGAETVEVTPRPQMNDLSAFPELVSFHLRNTWLHTPELLDNWLSDRLRWQAWTLRYE